MNILIFFGLLFSSLILGMFVGYSYCNYRRNHTTLSDQNHR